MTKFKVQVLLPIPASRWITERQTPAFRALMGEMLDLRVELMDTWQRDGAVFLKISTIPDHNAGDWLPHAARRHLENYVENGGAGLQTIDVIEMRAEELTQGPPYIFHVSTEIPMFGKNAQVHGTVTVEDMGPRLTRQTLECAARIRVPLLGMMAESLLKRKHLESYEKLPKVVENWERIRSQQSPEGIAELLEGLPATIASAPWVPPDLRSLLQPTPEVAVPRAGALSTVAPPQHDF